MKSMTQHLFVSFFFLKIKYEMYSYQKGRTHVHKRRGNLAKISPGSYSGTGVQKLASNNLSPVQEN